MNKAPDIYATISDAIVGANEWAEAPKQTRADAFGLVIGKLTSVPVPNEELLWLVEQVDADDADVKAQIRENIINVLAAKSAAPWVEMLLKRLPSQQDAP